MSATATTAAAPAMEALRGAFLETLRIRGCAPATLAARRQSLGMLIAFLAGTGVGDLRDVTRGHIAGFQRWLAARRFSDHTRSAHLGALRVFFAHLEQVDAILLNPCAELVVPRLPRRLPRVVLTPDEARRVLAAPDVRTAVGLRDKAILETFYSTGLRLAELARLTVSDMDHGSGFVRVNRGKGGHDRVVPIGAVACSCIRAYFARVRAQWLQAAQSKRDEPALWLISRAPHGPLQSQMIEVMVKKYGRASGIGKHLTPHVWRHTCATHLVAHGASLAAVQLQLGHRSLRTTHIYTRVAVPDLVAMHRHAHPRSRVRGK